MKLGLGIRGRLKRGSAAVRANVENLRLEQKYRRRDKKFGIENPIIIYQMGKVGSRSFYHSFKALDLDVPIYHAHALAHLDEYEAAVRANFPNPRGYLNSINAGRAVRRAMDSQRWRAWNLISMVRAPIPRSISEFFETLEAHLPDVWERAARGALSIQELHDYYLHQFQDTSPLNWFEHQLDDPFGIDVYAEPFDTARGYQIYIKEPVRLLIMRLEESNTRATEAMREFLGLEHFTLRKYNEGHHKYYSALYQQFTQTLKLPAAFIDQMHSTRYARHFYTAPELDASVKQWRA